MTEVRPVRSRQYRRAIVPVILVVVALTLALLIVGSLSALAEGRVSWLASVACSVATLFAAQATARRLNPGNPARRFWWAICLNAIAIGAGYLIQLATVTGAKLTMGPVPVLLEGLGTLVLVVVMFTYPLRIRSNLELVCFWLDMATVMVGAGAFGWYLAKPFDDVSSAIFSIVTGPVVMLVAVFAVAKLLIAGRPPFSLWPGVLGGCAAAIGGLLAVVGPMLLADGQANWFFALSASGDAFLMVAAWVQCLQVQANPTAFDRARRPYSTLPYVALAATFTLLTVALTGHGPNGRSWAVLGGAVISTCLVVLRQLASFSENARLLAQLDTKVLELSETEAGLRAALHERDALADRMREMAFQDSLTGLANRALFDDRLAAALARNRRDGTGVVVMLLDLDDFKPINDSFGHAAGDAVLREVGQRLRACLRDTDTVARHGGDEFAVVLHDPFPTSVPMVAERIVAAVGQPIGVNGVQVTVGISVGVATARCGEQDADRLLSDADAAMYLAKRNGKNGFEMYWATEPDDDHEVVSTPELVGQHTP